jgi:uncharacterized protein (TIGR02453 family)
MVSTLTLEPILGFLNELSQNNNKVWFESHRTTYASARNTFEQLINDLIDEFRVSDQLQDLSAKDCIARIYRDIRFSKDKSPYKTNMAAIIGPGGWKPTQLGYYISIAPRGQSMVAGGLYNPTSEQLNRFRQAIDRNPSIFKKLTHAKNFVETFGEVQGERLKSAPKGYDPSHPEIALLQLKQITVVRSFSDTEVLTQDFSGQVASTCRTMKPFLDYLNDIVQ